MSEVLSEEQVAEYLQNLSGWRFDEHEIKKTFEFVDFKQSLGFVNKVGELAETVNHHPEIKIDYNKVKIELSTHSAGGVTQKDIDLAKSIEQVYDRD